MRFAHVLRLHGHEPRGEQRRRHRQRRRGCRALPDGEEADRFQPEAEDRRQPPAKPVDQSARDRRGNLVSADYTWKVAGDKVTLGSETGRSVYVTSSANNGEDSVTVTAVGKAPTEGTAARSQKVIVFICENPWPSINTFPYEDQTTNFSLFYCRDAGEPGLADDLPPLQSAIAQPSGGDVIKEFLFTIK